jgi:uncharacterized membrane protein YgcG
VFYDKFNFRTRIADFLIFLWHCSPFHRDALVAFSRAHAPLFLRFCNDLVNDLDYLLSEALTHLEEMRAVEVKRRGGWAGLSPADVTEQEGFHRTAAGRAKGEFFYALRQLTLAALLTAEVTSPFFDPVLVDKTAAALGFYLDALVGGRRSQLRVEDPRAVGFNPRKVLLELAVVYGNLAAAGGAGAAAFAAAVVRDGRSFRAHNFKEAPAILLGGGGWEGADGGRVSAAVERLAALPPLLEAATAAAASAEEDLGELPDEVSDELMYDLLVDPVLLPSHKVMSRHHIVHSLMNETRDPFNRQFLTPEKLVPLPRMAAAVAEWVALRRRRRSGAAADAAGAEAAEVAALQRVVAEREAAVEAAKRKRTEGGGGDGDGGGSGGGDGDGGGSGGGGGAGGAGEDGSARAPPPVADSEDDALAAALAMSVEDAPAATQPQPMAVIPQAPAAAATAAAPPPPPAAVAADDMDPESAAELAEALRLSLLEN